MKKLLTKECEKWAKEHGGTEFASDCELCNSRWRIVLMVSLLLV